ncbi:hypothetical protein D3H35_01170 [Cohnella faecalis]|uniref:Uncharacterized protein n=1 Tax=Cohnella faecalis TaxID=2315694 RepID=A0A398D2L5_9BACL|nr:hypothetical protein D3H35_01170 [Cohnella faecalis]
MNAQVPQGFDANIYGIQLVNYTQDKSGNPSTKRIILFAQTLRFLYPTSARLIRKPKEGFFPTPWAGPGF